MYGTVATLPTASLPFCLTNPPIRSLNPHFSICAGHIFNLRTSTSSTHYLLDHCNLSPKIHIRLRRTRTELFFKSEPVIEPLALSLGRVHLYCSQLSPSPFHIRRVTVRLRVLVLQTGQTKLGQCFRDKEYHVGRLHHFHVEYVAHHASHKSSVTPVATLLHKWITFLDVIGMDSGTGHLLLFAG